MQVEYLRAIDLKQINGWDFLSGAEEYPKPKYLPGSEGYCTTLPFQDVQHHKQMSLQ
jgi:hypothetical protein